MFCKHCGYAVPVNVGFCPNCGKPLHNTNVRVRRYAVNEGLSRREHFCAKMWLVISCLQILIGLSESILILGIGIYNLVNTVALFQQAERVRTPYAELVQEYNSQLGKLIWTFLLNLFLGAFIGCIGVWYQHGTRKYVLQNDVFFDESYQKHLSEQSL